MIYLTVNDAPSGIFKSQVIDVIGELNRNRQQDVKLVVLLSFRNFKENKAQILNWYPKAVVKKMIPSLANWKKNSIILRFIRGIKTEKIIARGPLAFELAFTLNQKVIYDGRGAVKAELTEFPSMIPNKKIVDSIIMAEEKAVLKSDFKISVSRQLVKYWQSEFGYSGKNHMIIPCTLSESMTGISDHNLFLLKKLNWSQEDLLLIYSGSLAGWQSFKKVSELLNQFLKINHHKVLFLSKECEEIADLQERFPKQVARKWLPHKEVQNYLSIGDYGILIRDENVTNKVASPVKFAEYLSAGLQVLISPNLGDFTELVKSNGLGKVISNEVPALEKTSYEIKKQIQDFANKNFTKSAFKNEFKRLNDL